MIMLTIWVSTVTQAICLQDIISYHLRSVDSINQCYCHCRLQVVEDYVDCRWWKIMAQVARRHQEMGVSYMILPELPVLI